MGQRKEATMDEKRFDAWTRRRFGLGAGGLAASLLGVVGLEDADSKAKSKGNNGKHKGNGKGRNGGNNGKHKGNGKRKGPKCKKAGTGCQPVVKKGKRRCCDGLTCGTVPGFGGLRCCADVGASCSRAQQCCGGACVNGACAFVS
jgi:hypothetical protein